MSGAQVAMASSDWVKDLAVVALDQGDSLRVLLQERHPGQVTDDEMGRFKSEVIRALSTLASAFVLDPEFGLPAAVANAALARECRLIVSADRFTRSSDGSIVATDLDRTIDGAALVAAGASAMKLLVIWQADKAPDSRERLVMEFVDRCHTLGMLAMLECVTKPPAGPSVADGGPRAWVERAAREFASYGIDIYEPVLPLTSPVEVDEAHDLSRLVSASVSCPWVTLLSGVPEADQATVVRAAMRGGASGFVAGRSLWADAARSTDSRRILEESVAPRFGAMRHLVEGT